MTAVPSTAAAPPAPGPVKRWVLGARPRTLPAAVVPVLVGSAAAHLLVSRLTSAGPVRVAGPLYGTGASLWDSHWWRALGALVVALALQVGTNYANDYSDGIRGTDDQRVGPLRLVASGLASPSAVKRAAFAAFGLAGAVGLTLAWATSWWVLAVGAACLAAGWFYTGGPRPYGYAGFGELFVFLFFGMVATIGTFYVQTGKLTGGLVVPASVAVGLLATALLLANNLRDIETDRVAGKRTLAARVGRRTAGWFYVACVVLPFVGVLAVALVAATGDTFHRHPIYLFLPLLSLPLVLTPIRTVSSDASGRALLPVLAATGRLQLAFGALLAGGLWLWAT
ncbi:MAG TPA: 1,4-dihydroxy-2-naphthoate polyprenyltransferase [Acidimicrobiales bacterium]|jgi:1,4-dihydroxy-2-naphthoate octaprenyltransferase|nr:1,4-dihydroxy-2-naphthoate polyprenyltransferase [Acidimicrobiales bacterium]